jgi:FHA domain
LAPNADDRQISLEEVKAAAASRDLPGLVGRLVRERSWGSLTVLFQYAGTDGRAQVGLGELEAAARALSDALRPIRPPKSPRAALGDELRAVRLAAGEALLARSTRPALSEIERRALRQGATLLSEAGDHQRAAAVHEELGDNAHAAESWGAMGDLERMEAALAREEARDRTRREAVDAMRLFEVLITGGERRQAIAVAAGLSAGLDEAASARQLATRIDSRLVRGRAVTLRPAGGAPVRFAGLPALLGRDAAAELPLRDPGVSRRHALVRADGDELVIEDAGSRGGVRVAGARLGAALPLRGRGELALGATTVLAFAAEEGGRVVLTGVAGLDRQLRALVGAEPLPLATLLPEGEGLWLDFRGGGPRLGRRADLAVRVDGNFVGAGCDLLHGDVIDIAGPRPLRLEVE